MKKTKKNIWKKTIETKKKCELNSEKMKCT